MDSPVLRVCRTCCRAKANYTCPTCNAPYCSVACYKTHSVSCTESFYEAHVKATLRVAGGGLQGAEEKRRMLASVNREQEARATDALARSSGAPWVPVSGTINNEHNALASGSGATTINVSLNPAHSTSGTTHGDECINGSGDVEAGSDDEIEDSDEENEQNIDRLRELALGADSGELTLEALTPDERAAFLRAVADGSLTPACVAAEWTPWWRSDRLLGGSGGALPIGGGCSVGTPLVVEVEEGKLYGSSDAAQSSTNILPEAPRAVTAVNIVRTVDHRVACGAVKELRGVVSPSKAVTDAAAANAAKRQSSPILVNNVCEVLFAYAHCARLYCGDWSYDAGGAASVLLAISRVLAADARHASASVACASAVEASTVPGIALVATPDAGTTHTQVTLLVIEDVCLLLNGGQHVVRAALADVRKCFELAVGDAADVGRAAPQWCTAPLARNSAGMPRGTRRILDLAVRKIGYFEAWTAGSGSRTLLEAAQREVAAFHTQLLADSRHREFDVHSVSLTADNVRMLTGTR